MMTPSMSWEFTALAVSSMSWRRGYLSRRPSMEAGPAGCFLGHAAQLGTRAIRVVAVALFSVVGTGLILKVVDGLVELRVSPEDEATGLDLSQHDERVYS